jgi:Zn-dependent M28 family amino/carboxypeptidase
MPLSGAPLTRTALLLAFLAVVLPGLPRIALGQADAGSIADRYADQAQRIIAATLADNDAWLKMQELCDDIGHRLSGSEGLERAVEWAILKMADDGQENVRAQPAMVPRWVRGEESAEMLTPQRRPLAMLGLGGSVGTPPEGVTGDVISVGSFEELNARSAEAAGKIVLFDHAMSSLGANRGSGYGSAVQYRVAGARWAAQHGAIAALVRSVTTRSLQSPHTGAMNYFEAVNRIPAAALSVEDAERITRLIARGVPVRVTLKMQARMEASAPSANVIAELTGWSRPDEVVVIGGHLDSWDVGQGAQDDGVGCVICMEALNVLRKLDLRPRRTIRVVLFTNEENGLAGGKQYASDCSPELAGHVAAIEADSGGGAPLGFGASHMHDDVQACAVEQLADLLRLLEPVGATAARDGGGGADIGPMKPAGVALLSLNPDMTHYFDVHHTHADTLDKIDRHDLSRNVAAMAVVAYVLADMPVRLGEHEPR